MPVTVIDADAHVLETERTWDFMLETDQAYRPTVLVPKDPDPIRDEYWFVDGRVFLKSRNVGLDTPEAAREAADIKARLAHMDELGVDIHVLYPTIFLLPLTPHPEVETALVRGYNRWLAHIWKEGEGRLRWPVLVPIYDREAALQELQFGKDHGACGVFMRGTQGDHRLTDPWFFPVYELASALNLPICIHAATGNFAFSDYFRRDSGFSTFKLPAVGAFHDVVMKGMHKIFPDLKWAFIEVSASWIPYAMNDLSLRFAKRGMPWPGRELLEERNIFVACQTADDLDYVVDCAGPDHLVIGTDYGHADTATEIQALRNLREKGDLDSQVLDLILCDTPKRLYGL